MKELFLTQEITNVEGYIDKVVTDIKSVPANEELHMLITCVGGDVFQGDRLNRAILEHGSHTKATVIGLAASMGVVLLSAFDEVEIDSDAEIMLHKAHIPDMAPEDYTPEQRMSINRFNRKALSRLESKGVDADLLDEIFLSDSVSDVWLTAKEAEDAGIGKSVKIERKDSKPFRVAAKLNIQQIKNKHMGLFSKDKAVTRVATLKDGRQIVFKSESETLAKGDTVNLIGSNELLNGKIHLSNNMVAEIDEKNEVVNMEEEEEINDVVSDDEKQAIMERLDTLEKAVTEMMTKMDGGDSEEAKEVEAKKEEEYENKVKELEDAYKKTTDLLANAIDAASAIKSGYKLPAVEDKHEDNQTPDFVKNMGKSERRAYELNATLQQARKDKQEKNR